MLNFNSDRQLKYSLPQCNSVDDSLKDFDPSIPFFEPADALIRLQHIVAMIAVRRLFFVFYSQPVPDG